MAGAVIITQVYSALATLVLFIHLLFILGVVFGAFVARSRPVLRLLHMVSLIWGILTELVWPCPLTLLENWLGQRAGIEPYQGGFLLHYLDIAGVSVCVLNLTYYASLMGSGRHTE